MENSIGVSNGTVVQGFIEIEKISTKDNVKTHYKNTITNGGKQFLLAKSAGAMLSMTADVFGDVVCSNMLTKVGNSGNTVSAARQVNSDRDITNVILNLDENVLNGLSGSTSFVNIWDETMSNASKVVGYANNNVNPKNDNKEGIIDFCNGDYMVDPFTVCKRWKYPEGIATGTINAIGMMPGSCVKGSDGDAIKFSKCIDKINTQYANYASMSTGFLIPGIPGYTSNNEVLLNFKKDDNNRWKYNIGTGEITAVPETENFFIPSESYTIVDMQYIDNYLYVLSTLINGDHYDSIAVKVYDPANGMSIVADFTCMHRANSEYKIKACIFKYNNNLYISAASANSTVSMNKLWKLTVGSGGYATDATAYTDFSELGITLPSGLNIANVCIGSYGENYVLYNTAKVSVSLASDNKAEPGYKCVGYVFTDMNDIFNSIVDMIPGICPNEILFANSSIKGTLRVGFDYSNKESGFGDYYDIAQGRKIIMNNSDKNNSTNITVDTMTTGVYLTLDKWWTNIFSFVKLNTPIEKTDTDIIYVSYGYKII